VKKIKTETQLKLDRLRNQYRQLKKKGDIRGVLRVKALIAYYKGMPAETVAACYDVSLKTLKGWIKKFEAEQALSDQPRSGRPSKLSSSQSEELKQMISQHNQRVWTARHVYLLLLTVFKVCYSVKYLPQLLRQLGLSYHKAVQVLVKRDNEARRQWIQETLPNLYATYLQAGWRIFFQDEVGFQTEGTLAYTWGPKGQKTEINNYGRHGRVNLMGALELGSGLFYGVLTSFKVNACRFRRFLCHLKHELPTDKLILICDNARFHKAKWLTEWLKEQTSWLHLEFLPAYSPDFNPIERLWHWLKTEYTHNRCWASKVELKQTLQQMLLELPGRVNELKGLMQAEIDRLKQAFDYYVTPFPAPLQSLC
jgi:transposase